MDEYNIILSAILLIFITHGLCLAWEEYKLYTHRDKYVTINFIENGDLHEEGYVKEISRVY